jgi:hypothetical protein
MSGRKATTGGSLAPCAYQLVYLILLGSQIDPITDVPKKAFQPSNFLGLLEGYTRTLFHVGERYVPFFVNDTFPIYSFKALTIICFSHQQLEDEYQLLPACTLSGKCNYIEIIPLD